MQIKLSPSAAHRWLHCTPSAKLSAGVVSPPSQYADAGTDAHALAEAKLKLEFGGAIRSKALLKLQHARKSEYYLADPKLFEKNTDDYVNYIREIYNDYDANGGVKAFMVEETVSLPGIFPRGIADCIIVGEFELAVIDYKNGTGVKVDAIDNEQMMLYALAVLKTLPERLIKDIGIVSMHIFQPNSLGDPVEPDVKTVEELMEWLTGFVEPQAEKAKAGEGEYAPGDACKWCPAKVFCPKLAEMAEEALSDKPLDGLPDNKKVEKVLQIADLLTDYLSSIKAYALQQALNGFKWEGFKLVKGNGKRVIVDPDGLKVRLEEAGYKEKDIMTKPELLGLTALEKMVGKKPFQDLSEKHIMYKEGNPTLALASDKRSEYIPDREAKDVWKSEID